MYSNALLTTANINSVPAGTISDKVSTLLSNNRIDRLSVLLSTPDNWNGLGALSLQAESLKTFNRFCEYLTAFGEEPSLFLTDNGELELDMEFEIATVSILFKTDSVGVKISDISQDYIYSDIGRLDFFKSLLKARHFCEFQV